jgi:hypothetical protein
MGTPFNGRPFGAGPEEGGVGFMPDTGSRPRAGLGELRWLDVGRMVAEDLHRLSLCHGGAKAICSPWMCLEGNGKGDQGALGAKLTITLTTATKVWTSLRCQDSVQKVRRWEGSVVKSMVSRMARLSAYSARFKCLDGFSFFRRGRESMVVDDT